MNEAWKIDEWQQNIKNISFCITNQTILQCFWCCQEDWDINMREASEASEETHTGTYIKSENKILCRIFCLLV